MARLRLNRLMPRSASGERRCDRLVRGSCSPEWGPTTPTDDEDTLWTSVTMPALSVTFGDVESAQSDDRRVRRLVLANDLAASVDSARRQPPLEKPLLTWCEGDAIVQLLNALADVVRGEPLAELCAELAEKLSARLGPPPGYDVNAALRAIGDDMRGEGPA